MSENSTAQTCQELATVVRDLVGQVRLNMIRIEVMQDMQSNFDRNRIDRIVMQRCKEMGIDTVRGLLDWDESQLPSGVAEACAKAVEKTHASAEKVTPSPAAECEFSSGQTARVTAGRFNGLKVTIQGTASSGSVIVKPSHGGIILVDKSDLVLLEEVPAEQEQDK